MSGLDLIIKGKCFSLILQIINRVYFNVSLPGHLGTFMRCGEYCSGGPTLTHGRVTHQDQGDPLGDHGAGPEDAEQDEDGGQDVAEDQLEGDVEGVGGAVGGVDAEVVAARGHGAADGEFRGGGEQRQQHEGEQEQLALLQPGQHAGGALDEEQADEADHEVVGEADHPAGDEVVGGAALAGALPGHVSHLEDEAAQDPAKGGQSASEEDDRGGREVGDEDEDVLVLPVPHGVQAVLYDIGVIQQREGQPCLNTKQTKGPKQ